MPRVVLTTGQPSQRQIQICAPFGVALASSDEKPSIASFGAADSVRSALRGGGVAFLSGPSGSGKSTALRALERRLCRREERVVVHQSMLDDDALLIDIFGSGVSPEETFRRLAAFGLGEPALMARRVGELSEGQRHRADLARTFHDAVRTRSKWILIDEFASVLDRVTALSLGASVRKQAARYGLGVVCASAHDDIICTLMPAIVVRFHLDQSWALVPNATLASHEPVVEVERGCLADMDGLLAYHYVAGRPATRVGILRAFDRTHRQLAGVLVVSMPTLNGGWRQQAWPGRYAGRDRRASAGRINAELRCISRVIIDPRYRGLGVATKLVRAYLAQPMSVATEAVAAMGAICPFFERAGMRAYRVPIHAADARLQDALDAAEVSPWMLADPSRVPTLMRDRFVRSELRVWARRRRVVAVDDAALCRLAGVRVCVQPMAYAAVTPPNQVSSLATSAPWGSQHVERKPRRPGTCRDRASSERPT